MLALTESQSTLALGRMDGLDQASRSRKWHRRQAHSFRQRQHAFLQARVPGTTMALSAATAKTLLGVAAAANQVIKILGQRISHDGATSTNAPDLTEYGRCTFGGAGTSTSVTPSKLDPGRGETIQTAGTKNYSAEPTTITAIDPANVPQYNGLYYVMTPDTRPLIVVGGQGWVIRCTSPSTVNASGIIDFEE